MNSDLLRLDRTYLWHPSTQMKDYEKEDPLLIVKAEGIKLYDQKGNSYFDTISSWWCNVHGHNHPKIKQAIKAQLDELEHIPFAGLTHRGAILLAQRLVNITPEGLTKVFYSDNGSTACEVALKISYQYWKNTGHPERKKFISLDLGYHGDTIGAMSVGGISLYHLFSSLLFSTYKVPSPYCYRCPMGKERGNCGLECTEPLERLLEKSSDQIAGVILEPLLQAAGGMIVYPVEYLRKVAQLSKKYNVHLIVDEVATGFGRTGKMFAVEHAGVSPDLMCLSKGITSGYLPLAATLTTDKIYYAFYDDYIKNKTFHHSHTYSANPLAVAAALASLEIFDQDRVLERISKIIPVFHRQMERFRELPRVGDVRYIGMIGALELVRDKATKEPFSAEERVGWQVYKEGLKEGLILRPLGDVIYLFLPLCIKTDELAEIISRTYRVISSFILA